MCTLVEERLAEAQHKRKVYAKSGRERPRRGQRHIGKRPHSDGDCEARVEEKGRADSVSSTDRPWRSARGHEESPRSRSGNPPSQEYLKSSAHT